MDVNQPKTSIVVPRCGTYWDYTSEPKVFGTDRLLNCRACPIYTFGKTDV